MITIQFTGLLGTPEQIGPAPYFEADGRHLRAGPHGQIVARHEHLHWELGIGGRSFSGWECTDRATVHFKDSAGDRSTENFGPFSQVRFADGVCWGGNDRLASLDEEAGCWVVQPDEERWAILVLSPEEA
jgi:hypothetical protein